MLKRILDTPLVDIEAQTEEPQRKKLKSHESKNLIRSNVEDERKKRKNWVEIKKAIMLERWWEDDIELLMCKYKCPECVKNTAKNGKDVAEKLGDSNCIYEKCKECGTILYLDFMEG